MSREHERTRRQFLRDAGAAAVSAGSLSVLSGLGLNGCAGRSRRRPNVVLAMTDDHGYGDIGAHGSPTVKTPALDALHAESVRLTNFHADPCCSPTRASLLTGQYSARSGVWHTIGGRSLLARDRTTMADLFRAAGYRTGIFGKWHLGENHPFRPQDRGFEETLVHRGGAVGAAPDHWGNDYFDDTYVRNGEDRAYQGYCNTVWFDAALQFIRTHKDRPFFCYLPTNLPHAPLTVDDRYAEPYRSKVSDRLARYYGMLTKFDEDLARLLAEIRRLGLEDDTIVIFMSDNGPCPWYGGIVIDDDGFVLEGYSAGMRGGKIWGYENGHRVPCFVRWPGGGIGGGRDVERLTAHFDLLPTLVDCCGLKPGPGLAFDGTSLLPLLRDPVADWAERTLFVHNQRVDFPVKYKEFQVLTDRWRLIQPPAEEERNPALELYDIRSDPGQRNDIAARHPETVAALLSKYESWWDDVSGRFGEYNDIMVGSSRENPAILHAHDAHRAKGRQVWVVDVERDGTYEFRAFRWPPESGKKIRETREGAAVAGPAEARLRVGNAERSGAVNPEMTAAVFHVHLTPGRTCLEAWFDPEKTDKPWFAAAIEVRRVGPADPESANIYRPTDPDTLLR
ncbi:MAG: arylsulfatase [Candidatus Aminicenantes bacterium]|nr:arylsulfatase [Candidatus Aminicenantes bacterium]